MSYQILQGNAETVLPTLAPESVNCVVTSPPYFSKRDYGTATWVGGDAQCDHRPGNVSRVGKTTLQGGTAAAGHQQEGYKRQCPKCGAVRVDEQVGLEETPTQYVERMVGIFRHLHRVLRKDGTVWLNIGDSYAGSGGAGGDYAPGGTRAGQPRYDGTARLNVGLKAKNLIGIPWRLAFALQDDGWILRQDIIWHKPNPMPESAIDRCTTAHEYVFLLAKSPKYHFDMDAIAEPAAYDGRKDTIMKGSAKYADGFAPVQSHQSMAVKGHERWRKNADGQYIRSKRSVWSILPANYSGAHFATMPTELARLCVLAGCPRGGVVLDPFTGSGTTLAVAVANGRQAIGVELNPDYIALAHARIATTQPVLLEAA